MPEAELVAHCAQVNGTSEADASHAFAEAFASWHRLNGTYRWQIAIAPEVAAQFPDLGILSGMTT